MRRVLGAGRARAVLLAALAAALFVVLGAPPAAQAIKPRLRLERIDARRCADSGIVRLFVSELELEGTLRSFAPSSYHIVVDGTAAAVSAKSSARLAQTKDPLELAVAVQASLSYKSDMPSIRRALGKFIERLPARARVSLLVYGWEVRTLHERASAAKVAAAVQTLRTSDEAGSLALVPAARAAVKLLGRAPHSAVKLLVLLSNGLNRDLARATFRSFGDETREAGVVIDPIAYSASDERGPLLNLGEIAKRTRGTLRWARKPRDIRAQLLNLARQINGQMVLSFAVADRCQKEHLIQISRGVLRSNTIALPVQRAGAGAADGDKAASGGGGLGRWLPFVIGGALVMLLTLVVGLLLRKRRGGAPGK